ncbi:MULTISPECIES: META domain-containing protein [unclassified Oceanispirochaeta]|uniref:META domain-containing protein n=1 Tax=unclassified Oceanispirochaeta TaxID=2635722 RepID=UPI000E094E38|nr:MULTISPECIES: META domain-containing protein [unclassified Oceanispirochaeta]MBF9015934.1 META domain-containing protein [Oceanispirochaeta sp. M2]NPD72397.1 META domain-containing protein [Oceanispirochaeta sp. M1]RDG32168.1 META domain-containing protein [Oceanispirochaeta sp. M1]
MNRKQTVKTGSIFLLLSALIFLSGCISSSHETDEQTISAGELQNTIWISPLCGKPAEGRYSNDGFFLAEDGTLQFINIFSMTGDSWSLEGDDLLLYSHTERYPEPLPVSYPIRKKDGIVSILPAEDELEMLPPSAQEITAELPAGRWEISTMLNPESAAADPEHPAYIEIVKEDDGFVSIQGHGGVNNFRGVLNFDEFKWMSGPMMRTLMAGPALEYEDLFMRNLGRISRYLMLDDYLFLYEESELVLVMLKDQG